MSSIYTYMVSKYNYSTKKETIIKKKKKIKTVYENIFYNQCNHVTSLGVGGREKKLLAWILTGRSKF